MKIDLTVETELEHTPRVKQLSGMFDVPAQERVSHHWIGEVPLHERDWSVGIIVGPSGSGKTSVKRQLFGEEQSFEWRASSVIDDFDKTISIEDIAKVCSAVGFNTIPSWMKPHHVLSTGEKFRVDLARRLVEGGNLIVVDEFTSVVDRQVAQIGSHAVQRYVRRLGRQFVAVTCHYDVIEWLQPDWMLEPATMTFQWRSVQRRPELACEISRVDYSAWRLFAPYHYLTSQLHKGAACYVLFVNGAPASFCGALHMPHATAHDIKRATRAVTLPDYQGFGLSMALADTLGSAYKALGFRFHKYPAHPTWVRSHDRSPHWALIKKPGKFSPAVGGNSSLRNRKGKAWHVGGRPCAVFEYVGDAMDRDKAVKLLG